jgi:hypothetical protein
MEVVMPANHKSEAVVAQAGPTELAPSRYLVITPTGAAIWVEDPEFATAFPSMREATRAAMRLPAGLKAFSLPRETELTVRKLH